MCGIAGYVGEEGAVEFVLEGLKRLEYRGYDSAGVGFVNSKNQLQAFKKEGRIENLLTSLEGVEKVSGCALGHTRWATHGQVNDQNAHPHYRDGLCLVHNGIIENAQELRRELGEQGFSFLSETDSEVFLGLVWVAMEKGLDFRDAFLSSFERVAGHSAFVMMNSQGREILAIKKGAPLVCGLHEGVSYGVVSSDPYALVGFSQKLYFPEDGVLCSLGMGNKGLLNFFEKEGQASKRYFFRRQQAGYDQVGKGPFEHFMLKEIHEQPRRIRELIPFYFSGKGERDLEEVAQIRPQQVTIAACGTAAYAGHVIRNFFEARNQIPTHLELSSEFRYRNPILSPKMLGLFISQSGETADTLAAQELCLQNKVPTLSLVNVEGSTLYRQSDHNLLIKAGAEIGVASTKAFTQMALMGYLVSFAWSKDFSCEKKRKEIVERFHLLAERVEELIDSVEIIEKIVTEIYNKKGYFYTGRGIYYPIALEGALKLKEIAYVHAEGYAAGELKHGPIALIDQEMVNIAIVGPELKDKTISNVEEIKARRGIIVGIGPCDDQNFRDLCDYFIPMNYTGLEDLSPIYVNVANQLLAYYMAKFKGTDIDKPRNLAKSVTVE